MQIDKKAAAIGTVLLVSLEEDSDYIDDIVNVWLTDNGDKKVIAMDFKSAYDAEKKRWVDQVLVVYEKK